MLENLTERDKEILFLTANFGGKTFIEVLEKTLWYGYKSSKQQARNRMYVLTNRYGYFTQKLTGLMTPRNAYAVTERGRDAIRTLFDINLSPTVNVSANTTHHNIMEQVTFFWLKKLGKNPQRTIVKKWSINHKHTPDIYYETEKGGIYVEIEKTVKSNGAYNSIFANIIQDKVYKVLYVVENEKRVFQFAKNLPKSEKIMLIAIDNLVENASKHNKIGAISQKKALEIKNQKNQK